MVRRETQRLVFGPLGLLVLDLWSWLALDNPREPWVSLAPLKPPNLVLSWPSLVQTKTRSNQKPKIKDRSSPTKSPLPCASRLHLLGEVCREAQDPAKVAGVRYPNPTKDRSDPPADIAPSLSRSRTKRLASIPPFLAI